MAGLAIYYRRYAVVLAGCRPSIPTSDAESHAF